MHFILTYLPVYASRHCCQWPVASFPDCIIQAYIEKEDSKKLKQKQRERMQPKMGKMDIDYQVFLLHFLFFKFVLPKYFVSCGVSSEWFFSLSNEWVCFLFVRFSMMLFLNTKLSQSLQVLEICIMKAKSLRYLFFYSRVWGIIFMLIC